MNNQYMEFPQTYVHPNDPRNQVNNPHNMHHVDPRFIPAGGNGQYADPNIMYGGGPQIDASHVTVGSKYDSVSNPSGGELNGTYGMDNNPAAEVFRNDIHPTNTYEHNFNQHAEQLAVYNETPESNVVISSRETITNEYIKPLNMKYVQESNDIFSILKHIDITERNTESIHPIVRVVYIDNIVYSKNILDKGYLKSVVTALGRILDSSNLRVAIPPELNIVLTDMFNSSFKFEIDSFVNDITDVHSLFKGSPELYAPDLHTFRILITEFLDDLKIEKLGGVYRNTFKHKINIITNNVPELEKELVNVNHINTPIPKDSILYKQILLLESGGDIVLQIEHELYIIRSKTISILKGV